MAENKFIHIRNLEKYHPGYRDRELKWAKIYFNTIQGDPETEMLCEIDRGRFISFILLELQAKKPIPVSDDYFIRKGFDIKNRPMSLTLNMLQNFIDVVTELSEDCGLDKSRVEEEKNIIEEKDIEEFEKFWKLYDKKTGCKDKLIKKWIKLSQKDKELIFDYIPKYKIAQPNKQYRKNPETFLNNKSWLDEIINVNNNTFLKLLPEERDAYWYNKYPKDIPEATRQINKMKLVIIDGKKYWVMLEDQKKFNLELFNGG